jgi:altronate dehydratase
MKDIIDVDTGPVIAGKKTIEQMGEDILEFCIKAASGQLIPKAVQLSQLPSATFPPFFEASYYKFYILKCLS